MSADNIWVDGVRAAVTGVHLDSRNGGCMEGLAFQGFGDPCHPVVWSETRGMSVIYAAAELLWYLTSRNDDQMICHYAPSYKQYLNHGVAMGAYGPRIFSSHAAKDVAAELMRNETRRAVIPIFDVKDLRNTREGVDCNDIPCTLTLQYINRDGLLHSITTMRSNDVWKGMPYDLFAFMILQLMICEATGLRPGAYWHQVGSLHLYDRDEDRLAGKELGDADHETALKLEMNSEVPTIMRTPAIRADEAAVRAGEFRDREHRLAENYGAFSISCTLLTLASLQNYLMLSENDIDRLSEIIDRRLVLSASRFLAKRYDKAQA